MGLIKQCDDQMGRLFKYLEDSGQMENTIIVLTSDHGDYLGDHWLGEKDLFHAPSVKVPLVVYDPSSEADATRGTVCNALVEAIDLTASFVEHASGEVPDHILEGKSLWPIIHGQVVEQPREFVVSEYDYSQQQMAKTLGVSIRDARLFMVADKRWKFMHAEGGFRPMLFDLENDPNELNDLGGQSTHKDIIEMMYQRLAQWGRRMAQRTTIEDKSIHKKFEMDSDVGIMLGVYDDADVPDLAADFYRGKAKGRYLK